MTTPLQVQAHQRLARNSFIAATLKEKHFYELMSSGYSIFTARGTPGTGLNFAAVPKDHCSGWDIYEEHSVITPTILCHVPQNEWLDFGQ